MHQVNKALCEDCIHEKTSIHIGVSQQYKGYLQSALGRKQKATVIRHRSVSALFKRSNDCKDNEMDIKSSRFAPPLPIFITGVFTLVTRLRLGIYRVQLIRNLGQISAPFIVTELTRNVCGFVDIKVN